MKTQITEGGKKFTPFDVTITVESRAEQRVLAAALQHYAVKHARFSVAGAEVGEKLMEAAKKITEAA